MARGLVALLEFLDRVHQGLWHKAAAEFPESPARVGPNFSLSRIAGHWGNPKPLTLYRGFHRPPLRCLVCFLDGGEEGAELRGIFFPRRRFHTARHVDREGAYFADRLANIFGR